MLTLVNFTDVQEETYSVLETNFNTQILRHGGVEGYINVRQSFSEHMGAWVIFEDSTPIGFFSLRESPYLFPYFQTSTLLAPCFQRKGHSHILKTSVAKAFSESVNFKLMAVVRESNEQSLKALKKTFPSLNPVLLKDTFFNEPAYAVHIWEAILDPVNDQEQKIYLTVKNWLESIVFDKSLAHLPISV